MAVTPRSHSRSVRADGEFSSRRLFGGEEDTGSLRTNMCSVLQLEEIAKIEETKFPELAFTLQRVVDSQKQALLVTQRGLANHPPFGLTSRVQVTIEDCEYKVHILMRELESGVVNNEEEVHELVKRFSNVSSYKFCPGIEWTHYEERYFNAIRFDLKSVRRAEMPFYRIDSELQTLSPVAI